MKLMIQIPCYNEAASLPITLSALPRHVDGFDTIEIMVIDDGSTDDTVPVARSRGVTHVIRLNSHQGLARAFMAGLIAGVERGADVIVNTDADNQYCARYIETLVKPIIHGQADVVVGARPIRTMRHFSPVKRLLERIGTAAVRRLSGAEIQDAPSGFRAITRDAALRLNVFGDFTYTIETTIQAALSRLRVLSVPVEVNSPMRQSRLFLSNSFYIYRSVRTMVSVYLIYRPARLFGALATTCIVAGIALAIRYLVLLAVGEGKGHVQSVIACASLLLGGLFISFIGAIAHLLSINRQLLEEIRYLVRKMSLRASSDQTPGRAPSPRLEHNADGGSIPPELGRGGG